MNRQEKVESFLEFFKEYYEEKIAEAVNKGEEAIKIDFEKLARFDSELADSLIEDGEEGIDAAEEALEEMPILEDKTLKPRFFNLSKEEIIKIRNLRSEHLGKLIAIEGIVRRASEVRPEVETAVFECKSCGNTVEKEQESSKLKSPYKCQCGSRKFEVKSKNMVDLQVVNIEESPEKIRGSSQPRKISAYLRRDLVDPDFQKRVVPGNKVVLTGVLNEVPMKNESKRYDFYFEGNFLEPKEMEFEQIEITKEEEEKILDIASSPNVFEKLSNSIAPSIYGLEEVKKAIALQLFSGVRKSRPDGTSTRGDMHVLLIGEPGTGKSILLQFAGEIAPKGRYLVGKSATAAGATASVVRDEMTGGFALEAGALVLANKGLAALDEIDKMDAEDRSALHEAAEQQTISISKANIQATLQARTSILAAGNPKFGRFDPFEPIAEQINISETLLSRFDLIFPIRDVPDKEKDMDLADHVLSMHMEPEEHKGTIDQDLLRKYVAYAKRNVEPSITDEAKEEIKEFYLKVRSKSSTEEEGESSVPISARQLEALIRLSEASAKSRLSEKVEKEDAKRSINLLTHCLKQVGVDPETGEFDIDRIESGITSSQRNRIRSVLEIVNSLSEEVGEAVPIEDVIAEAEERGLSEADEIIKKLKREGELFEPKQGHVQKI